MGDSRDCHTREAIRSRAIALEHVSLESGGRQVKAEATTRESIGHADELGVSVEGERDADGSGDTIDDRGIRENGLEVDLAVSRARALAAIDTVPDVASSALTGEGAGSVLADGGGQAVVQAQRALINIETPVSTEAEERSVVAVVAWAGEGSNRVQAPSVVRTIVPDLAFIHIDTRRAVTGISCRASANE